MQLVAGVEPPVLATEPLAVEQVGPGQLGPQRGAAQPLDRLGVALLGLLAFADQRSRARLQALRPVGTLDGRHGRQPAQRFSGKVRPSGSHGGLDQFGQNQLRAQGLVGLLGRRLRHGQRLCVAPEAVVEDRCGPVGHLDGESLPASRRVLGGRREERYRFRRPAPVPGEQQITGGSQPDPGHLVDDVLLCGQRRRCLEVAAMRGHLPRPFKAMDNGARAPEARASSTCRVLNATQLSKSHTAMAAIWAKNPPLQPLFPGHLITEECVHCSPQRRLCCRTPLGDHRRQTVEEEVTRPRSPRWLRGRSCRPGNLQQKPAGSGERTSEVGCHPGVKVGLPGEPGIE